jgi:hypothetical protein
MQSQLTYWKLFCGYQQIDSEVYMERQKTHNSQHSIKEQSWKTNTNQLQLTMNLK